MHGQWVVIALCLFYVDAVPKICQVTSDCGLDEICCENICVARRDCEGTCNSDHDCDEKFGEKCIDRQCKCVEPPCTTNDKLTCGGDARLKCPANMTCVKGVCQHNRESVPTRDPNFSPAVLAVVATLGLLFFAGAFYFCLRKQHTTRPSLASKGAHRRAMEKARSSVSEHRVSFDDSAERGNSRRTSENSKLCETTSSSGESPGNNHKSKQEGHHKSRQSSLVGSIDLSAIIEEEEVSDVTSK